MINSVTFVQNNLEHFITIFLGIILAVFVIFFIVFIVYIVVLIFTVIVITTFIIVSLLTEGNSIRSFGVNMNFLGTALLWGLVSKCRSKIKSNAIPCWLEHVARTGVAFVSNGV